MQSYPDSRTILALQYEWVRGSRKVMLDFIRAELPGKLNTGVESMQGKTIGKLLVHIGEVYFHWAGDFASVPGNKPSADGGPYSMSFIGGYFEQVDSLVERYLDMFASRPGIILKGNENTAITPLQLLTHLITHEFHHKGQIMSICRLLGAVPPDTDIIRF